MFRKGTSSSENGNGNSPPSSAESEADALPTLNDQSIDRVMGQPVTRPGMRLPPVPPSPPVRGIRTGTASFR